MNQDVVSFVLRFIREESNGHPARWRGVIKHVQSDHNADFAQFSDALAFMQAHVDEAIRQAFSGEAGQHPPTPENMLTETTRLWGEMAPRYTDIMLQSMQMMIEQSRRMGATWAQNMTNWARFPVNGLPPYHNAEDDDSDPPSEAESAVESAPVPVEDTLDGGSLNDVAHAEDPLSAVLGALHSMQQQLHEMNARLATLETQINNPRE